MENCTWLDMTNEEEWRSYSEEFEERENETKSTISSITHSFTEPHAK